MASSIPDPLRPEILEGIDELPHAVREIVEVRLAARQIVRGDRPFREKVLELLDLADSCSGLEIPSWCQRAVWLEAIPLLISEDDE